MFIFVFVTKVGSAVAAIRHYYSHFPGIGNMAKTRRYAKDESSVLEGLNNVFTGTPVNVRVEEIECSQDEYLNHLKNRVGDFDAMDFFLPLSMLVVVFVFQFIASFFFPAYFFAIGIQILLYFDLLKRVRRRTSGRVVTGFHPPAQNNKWGQGFIIYFGCLPGIVAAIWVNQKLMNKLFPQPTLQEQLMNSQGSVFSALIALGLFTLLLEFFMIVVFAPLNEELWFRGIGLASLTKNGSVIRAVIITSLIFGALHGPGRFIFASVFGLVMALIRFRTGSLYCCMLVHGVHNFGALVIGIYLMYRQLRPY